jgi:hypothetical protein
MDSKALPPTPTPTHQFIALLFQLQYYSFNIALENGV